MLRDKLVGMGRMSYRDDPNWLDKRVSSSVRWSRRTLVRAGKIAEKSGYPRNTVLEIMVKLGLDAFEIDQENQTKLVEQAASKR